MYSLSVNRSTSLGPFSALSASITRGKFHPVVGGSRRPTVGVDLHTGKRPSRRRLRFGPGRPVDGHTATISGADTGSHYPRLRAEDIPAPAGSVYALRRRRPRRRGGPRQNLGPHAALALEGPAGACRSQPGRGCVRPRGRRLPAPARRRVRRGSSPSAPVAAATATGSFDATVGYVHPCATGLIKGGRCGSSGVRSGSSAELSQRILGRQASRLRPRRSRPG